MPCRVMKLYQKFGADGDALARFEDRAALDADGGVASGPSCGVYLNDEMPVAASPRISVWMSCVPS
jgi:hypothetical protein